MSGDFPPPARRKMPSGTGTYRAVREEQPAVAFEEHPTIKSRISPEHVTMSTPPPAGDVQFRGNGWKINVPTVIVTAVIAALGTRFIPAQNPADADARAEHRLEAMRNAEFRQEMREAVRQIEARQAKHEDVLHNYRSILEDRLTRLDDRLTRLEKKP